MLSPCISKKLCYLMSIHDTLCENGEQIGDSGDSIIADNRGFSKKLVYVSYESYPFHNKQLIQTRHSRPWRGNRMACEKNHAHEAFMRRGATRDAWGFRMNPQQSQCRRGKYIFRTASRSCPVRRSIMGSLISQPDHFLRLPVFSEPRISS